MKELFHSSPAPFHAERDGNRIVISNEYVRIVHDLSCGGEMTEAVVVNGSGTNLFARPQTTVVGVMEHIGKYHSYRSCALPATDWKLSEHEGNPVLEVTCTPAEENGNTIDGLLLHHRIEYTPWGEALHKVTLSAAHKIEKLWMVQVGTLFPAARMNCLAIHTNLVEKMSPFGAYSKVKGWDTIDLNNRGKTGYYSRWIPENMLLFEKGVDGFQYCIGDDLATWETGIPGTFPGLGMGYFAWRPAMNCYEMRFSAVDCPWGKQYLEGDISFEFSLAFPFVRKQVVPLSPCSGNLLQNSKKERWPDEELMQKWEDGGVSLMRLHNDGDPGNGIFWRDAAYPPYPPEEMKKMDDTLEAMHRHGIHAVPYFSLHEYHPEAAGFKENAEKWGRIAIEGDTIIPSYAPKGYYGYEMCLNSGWYEKRRDTIDQALTNHKFDGIYYDWCSALECFNPAHGKHHWDFRKLMNLLEWSHKRVGEKGAMYLHLTANPNIAAENMASVVLTEESAPGKFSGQMFSPHAHFLNIAPRQVCLMIPDTSPEKDLLRYAMCALLNHATVSCGLDPFPQFYKEQADLIRDCVNYRRHTAPGEGLCSMSDPDTEMSAYWDEEKALLLFVNLSEEKKTADYRFSPDGKRILSGTVTLEPLSVRREKHSFR